jgi:RNA:NAD 2'-phosphotransferase (TPT1/KptA family)
MVKGRMAKTSIPTEEVELLTNEYKRVKTKKDKGRFELKGKKITAGSFSIGQVKAKLSGTKPKGLLPAAIGKSPIASSLTESIATIASTISSIAEKIN